MYYLLIDIYYLKMISTRDFYIKLKIASIIICSKIKSTISDNILAFKSSIELLLRHITKKRKYISKNKKLSRLIIYTYFYLYLLVKS